MGGGLARVWAIFRHPHSGLPLLTGLELISIFIGLRFDERMIGSDEMGVLLPLPAIFVFGRPGILFSCTGLICRASCCNIDFWMERGRDFRSTAPVLDKSVRAGSVMQLRSS